MGSIANVNTSVYIRSKLLETFVYSKLDADNLTVKYSGTNLMDGSTKTNDTVDETDLISLLLS